MNSYDRLADEYYDAIAHPTCQNLNRLSRIILDRWLPEPWSRMSTLEVGAGDSATAAILFARGYELSSLSITDDSERMLAHSAKWSLYGASLTKCVATSLTCANHSVDLLVASLADPYNSQAFWAEAHRAISSRGTIILTMPSHEWASRFRAKSGSDLHTAEFVLRSGEQVSVPSLIPPLHEQVKMMTDAGFLLSAFESLGALDLGPLEPRSPKIEVFTGGVSSLVWGFKLVPRS